MQHDILHGPEYYFAKFPRRGNTVCDRRIFPFILLEILQPPSSSSEAGGAKETALVLVGLGFYIITYVCLPDHELSLTLFMTGTFSHPSCQRIGSLLVGSKTMYLHVPCILYSHIEELM